MTVNLLRISFRIPFFSLSWKLQPLCQENNIIIFQVLQMKCMGFIVSNANHMEKCCSWPLRLTFLSNGCIKKGNTTNIFEICSNNFLFILIKINFFRREKSDQSLCSFPVLCSQIPRNFYHTNRKSLLMFLPFKMRMNKNN